MGKIRVAVWNEHIQDKNDENVKKIYPEGMNAALKKGITAENDFFEITELTMDMPEHGLTDDVLKNTDVLIWWAHLGHDNVKDEIAARVVKHVQAGMGFIALHSAHLSKPFTWLLGTTGSLGWRESEDMEIIWNVNPTHPITKDIPRNFILSAEETYMELFDVPKPDDNIFISWFSGGEVFRSGLTYTRGRGKIFYFQPGHESNPTYYNPTILQVIKNAIVWAKPDSEKHFYETPWMPPVIKKS